MRQAKVIDKFRDEALKRIVETRIAGKDTRHSRANNLQAIKEMLKGHPHYTFGIKGVERLTPQQALDAISDVTKCSKDPNYTEGGGYISPESCLKGLELGARNIAAAAKRGGRFVVGTGHPGSLLAYYIELVKLIRDWGGEVVEVERGAFVPPNLDLDFIEGVAVVSDRCSLWHSHDIVPMEIILRAAGPIDLAVTDHGFAGAAVNAGIPVVGIIDTNDPALAAAKFLGANAIIIPMDDNRPLSSYTAAVDIVREFGEREGVRRAADGGRAARKSRQLRSAKEISGVRPEIIERIKEAERLVKQRLGPQPPLDEMAEALLDGFREQFIQTHFDMDKEYTLINDPFVWLAIYGQLWEAIDHFLIDQIKELEPDLIEDEVRFYFDGLKAA